MSESSRPKGLPEKLSQDECWRLLDAVRTYGGSKFYQGGHKRKLLRKLASFGFRGWLDLIAMSGKLKVEDPHGVVEKIFAGEGMIAAIWHNKLLGALFTARNSFHRAGHHLRTAAIISESNDGELIARVFRDARGTTIRGSNSRRATDALRAMVSEAKRGGIIVATPDGPRGPKHVLQDGVIMAARLAGVPLVPMAAHFGRSLRFARSWDQFEIPLPFGDVTFAYGEPLDIPRRVTDEELDDLKLVFAERMAALTARLEAAPVRYWNLGREKVAAKDAQA